MRIGIAGAGAVGRSVAQELLDGGHRVLLIEHKQDNYQPRAVPAAEWLLGDACELSVLTECGAQLCDVIICATGDDRANLAVALLAKSEFLVPRVVARVNDWGNEWLFTEEWGVDVAVSTPRAMVAGIEEAIDVSHLVAFMGLRRGQANVAKLTLPDDNPLVGRRVCDLGLPDNAALICVLRGETVMLPHADEAVCPGDEMWFCADAAAENQIRATVHGG